jgi:hypothetical protein
LTKYIATVETATHRVFQFLDAVVLPDNKLIVIASDDAFDLGVLSSRVHLAWALRAGGWLGQGNDPVYVKSRCFDPFPFPVCSDALKAKIRAVAEELDAHRKARQAEHPRLTLTQMYNVLEKLRAAPHAAPSPRSSRGEGWGEGQQRAQTSHGQALREGQRHTPTPAQAPAPHPSPLPASGERGSARHLPQAVALTSEEEDIKDKGLVLILKELHDQLDALVFEAYGWPADLSDEQILERLVALNKERAAEEKAGTVRWLRPDYQVPRFGSDAERARLAEEKRQQRELRRTEQTTLALDDDLQEMKPRFPTSNELEETAAVMRVLASATGPLSVADIARTFQQGQAIARRVELTVSALARLGHLVSTDEARTFALRRA